MNTQELYTVLAATLAVGVSLGFAVSQYRAWVRARRSRRIAERLLNWE